jgi:hypothetical protein
VALLSTLFHCSFGLTLCLAACASSSPDAASPPARHRLVQSFALHRADEAHDLGEGVDSAALPAGVQLQHEGTGGYFSAPSEAAESLRSFVRSLRIPPGEVVLFGNPTPAAIRTYLVQAAPIFGDGAIVASLATTRHGVPGVVLTFGADGYETLRTELSNRVVVVVQGAVEPASVELLDDGTRAAADDGMGGPPLPATCWDNSIFVALAARDGDSAEARAKQLTAGLPPSSVACQGAPP